MSVVLSFVGIAAFCVACVFVVPGWLLDRPVSSRRYLHRFVTQAALALAMTAAADRQRGVSMWMAYGSATIWIWLALDQWKRVEKARQLERRWPR